MAKGSQQQTCEECRSKSLYTSDGYLWCRQCGTRQEGFVQTQQDDDFGTLRSSQVTRQKKEVKEKVKKTTTGSDALCLYLSAYQLILQHLCRALIDDKGLSSKLEIIVKDLWELRMKLVHERYLATRPQNGDDEESQPTMYSSQTESEATQTDAGGTTDGSDSRPSKIRQERDFPNIVDMLALCYMACIILRIPLSIGDMFRWATREEIPFVNALRLVPPEMQHRLSQRWLPFLQTRATLRLSRLHSAVHDLQCLYARHYSMELPALNYGPLLYRYIVNLTLPIDLFLAVVHLSSILSGCFSFPKPSRRTTFLSQPEIQLIACLVVSLKIYYPFSRSTPTIRLESITPEDRAATLGATPLDWTSWLAIQQDISRQVNESMTSSSQPFKPGTQSQVTSEDILAFGPEQMDAYMDWYEQTCIDAVPRQTFHDSRATGDESGDGGESSGGIVAGVIKMFSPSRHALHETETATARNSNSDTDGQQSLDERIRHIHENAIKHLQSSITSPAPGMADSDGELQVLPGQDYIHYRHLSDLGVDTPARIFHERLAEYAGLKIDDLLKAVYKIERRLIKSKV